jgi:hypothetical protein
MNDDVSYEIPTLATTNPSYFKRSANIGSFQKGNLFGKGRPRGSRNKLEEDFLLTVQQDFHRYGAAAIVKVRKKDPVAYLKMIASLMPKSLNVQAKVEKVTSDMSDEELLRMVIDVTPLQEGETETTPAIEATEP